MCLDISFKIERTEDSLYDYLPHLKIDPQIEFGFEEVAHVQAHNRPKTKIIYMNSDGDPYLTLMRWGMMTKFMIKDGENFKKYGNNMYNCRSEYIFDKTSSWYRIRHQRCLIDVAGVYEHRKVADWKNKVPYLVRLANKKRLLIPALYNFLTVSKEEFEKIKFTKDKNLIEAINKVVNLESGEVTGTFAMITRQANTKMAHIHNDGTNKYRMPLFLQPEQAIKWLDPEMSEFEMKEILDYEIPSEDLEAWPVHTIRTTNLRPDGKEKCEMFDWAGLPPLGDDTPIQNLLF